MKVIALFLSIIVITLTVTPCCAFENEEACALEKKEAGNQKQHQTDDCCKDCSPFYTCGTCIGFVVANKLVITVVKPEVSPIAYSNSYFSQEINGFYTSVWQPPKLS